MTWWVFSLSPHRQSLPFYQKMHGGASWSASRTEQEETTQRTHRLNSIQPKPRINSAPVCTRCHSTGSAAFRQELHKSEWPTSPPSRPTDYNSQHAPGPAAAAVHTRRAKSMLGTVVFNCKALLPILPSPCQITQQKHPRTPPAPHPARRLTTPPPAQRSHCHQSASVRRAVSKLYRARNPAHAHWQPPPPA